MDNNAFKAASYYDYHLNKKNRDIIFPLKLVVFNADEYSVGFCTCSKEGEIRIVCNFMLSDCGNCLDDINTIFCKETKDYSSITDCLQMRLDSFNHMMRNYFRSARQLNSSFKELLGLEMNCSDFENLFKIVEDKINRLFSSIDDKWAKCEFDENEVRIIIIGKAAIFYPIEYYIKSHLTFDPFLTDERFANDSYPDSADKIVIIGTEAYIKKKSQEHEIYIHILNVETDLVEKKKLSFSSQQNITEKLKYYGPILVTVHEPIKLEIDSKTKLIKVPYSIDPLEGDIVEVGICLNDGRPAIRIRRHYYPTRIYDIPII